MALDVDRLCFARGSQEILDEISFAAKPGEITVILGPNGVGKTTLLKCLNRILAPSRGEVRIKGRDTGRMAPRQIARHIAYVAQQSETAHITAFDAILLGRKPHMGMRPRPEDLEKVDAVITHLGLEDLSLKPLTRMSGGELQKVCIARALAQETDILLMDEPTASLDLKNEMRILSLIRHIVEDHHMAAVITMHDLNAALRYGHRFLFLKDGRLHATGAIHEVTPAMISEVYGMNVEILHHNGLPLVVPMDETRAA